MQEKNEIQEMAEEKMEEKRNKCWRIDKEMLPYKIHFFIYKGAMAALLPFQPTIGIRRLGLGADNLAMVFTVMQFLFIVVKPLIGYIADYFNNLKKMIIFMIVINCIVSYLLLALPAVDVKDVSARNESRLGFDTKFCEACNISNELQKTIDLLPESTNISDGAENGIVCYENNIQENLIVHCMETNASSSFPISVVFMACYLSTEKSGENSHLQNSSENSTYFVVRYGHNFSQFSIMCPVNVNHTGFGTSFFSLDYLTETCSKYLLKNTDKLDAAPPKNMSCSDPELNDTVKFEIREWNSFETYQFWVYTLLLMISGVCTSSIFTLSDTACHESVQVTGTDYGKQRAWGAIGPALVTPFAGFLNDYTDSYWAGMILMTVLCVLLIWNLSKMDLVKPQLSQNILKDVKLVLSSTEFIAFDVSVFFNGMGIGIVWFFLSWFVNDIGGSGLLLGLAHTVQCLLGEMPFMLISGWLIKRIGHFNVVSLSMTAHCVRFLAYSYLRNPWMILPIECLDGITFGLFYTAMTSYGKLSSKPGTEATTQSLLCSSYECLGAGLGCVIAGICFENYGGHTTFFYAGLCFAVAAAINMGSTLLLHCRKGSLNFLK